MPARSKAQARLMGAAAAGKVRGIKKKDAREYLRGTNVSSLPERKRRKRA